MGMFGFLDVLFNAASAGLGELEEEEFGQEAQDTMYSMCGNAGQEAILDKGMSGFEQWTDDQSDGGGSGPLEGYLGLSGEQYNATGEIWEAGAEIVAEGTATLMEQLFDDESESAEGDDDW